MLLLAFGLFSFSLFFAAGSASYGALSRIQNLEKDLRRALDEKEKLEGELKAEKEKFQADLEAREREVTRRTTAT